MMPVLLRPRAIAAVTMVAAGALSAAFAMPCDAQTREEREIRVTRAPGGITIVRGMPANRAMLGVTLADPSSADTAGVRLEGVEAEGPAAKAGLKAGDVITAINGVSLKVSREDAEDSSLDGLGQRRLQREMAKAKPGDDIRLQLRSGSTTRAVTVKAMSADELERAVETVEERVIRRGPEGTVIERHGGGTSRGVVGVSIGSAGNARDTLGLFVNSVTGGGPADKAGIIEGERIAAVNGIDVRVPREDVEDVQAASARVDRFVREVQKTEPGKTVALRVWGNGRYREVSVTVQRAEDLPDGATMGGVMLEAPVRVRGMRLPDGEGRTLRRDGDPRRGEPQVFEFRREGPRGRLRINGTEIEIDGNGFERAFEEMGRRLQDRFRDVERDVEIDLRGLRTLPERSGAVRIRTTRTAV